MIRSAVTVSLVEQARRGPFVFHGDLVKACSAAAELGFDAIELFASSADDIRRQPLNTLLKNNDLQLAAVGTGAGMLIHRLQLCDADPKRRRQAVQFIREIIDAGAEWGAPAIIGSMQGRWDEETDFSTAMNYLKDGLNELGTHASIRGVPLYYEPLNRYETNLITTLEQGNSFLQLLETKNVRLLADLFHMNIEESSSASAIRNSGSSIGHIHFVDSNRHAAGRGHIDYAQISAALKAVGYSGYLSAEALPIPDSVTAATSTIETFRRYFR
jgi:sugar phosphate isomerase/epimerase